MFSLERPRLPVPVRLPALFFADRATVLIAELATHPAERMVGCLATLVASLPEAGRPELVAMQPEIAAMLMRLWAPDLCILDARQVRRWDEEDTLEVVAGAGLIVGPDPLAVDTAGALSLGLEPGHIPLLAGARRALRRPWPRIQGVPSPPGGGPGASRQFRETALRRKIQRLAWRTGDLGDRLLGAARIPEVVAMVRRARTGS
jgi:hypothetical protein